MPPAARPSADTPVLALSDRIQRAITARVEAWSQRRGTRPRLDAAAWQTATSPARIADLLYRRAGVTEPMPTNVSPDGMALLLALEFAPGWTPKALTRRLARSRMVKTSPWWEFGFARNAALDVSWITAALQARQSAGAIPWTLLHAVADRIASATPPRGWSPHVACWRSILEPLTSMQTASTGDTKGQSVAFKILGTVAASADATDVDLAAALSESIAWQSETPGAFRAQTPISDLQRRILQHPAADAATWAVFLWMARARNAAWWGDLPAIRPDWLTRSEVQAAIAALPTALGQFYGVPHPALVQFVCCHAPAESAAAYWLASFSDDVAGHWAMLGAMPEATVARLHLTTHDLTQALKYAPTTEARLGVLTALRGEVAAPDPGPPAVEVLAPDPDWIPPVVVPEFAAHTPVVRAWLGTLSPGVAEHLTAVRDREEAYEDRRRADADETMRRMRRNR